PLQTRVRRSLLISTETHRTTTLLALHVWRRRRDSANVRQCSAAATHVTEAPRIKPGFNDHVLASFRCDFRVDWPANLRPHCCVATMIVAGLLTQQENGTLEIDLAQTSDAHTIAMVSIRCTG